VNGTTSIWADHHADAVLGCCCVGWRGSLFPFATVGLAGPRASASVGGVFVASPVGALAGADTTLRAHHSVLSLKRAPPVGGHVDNTG